MRKFTLVILTIIFTSIEAMCCTGLYIGKKCSVNGATVIARCNDTHPLAVMPYIEIVEARKGVEGRYVKGIEGFSWPLPADTYKYLSVPYPAISDFGTFASVVSNEFGVALTATITGYYSEEAAKADPDVRDGVAEETIPSILAPCCRTAREAVELLAQVVDQKGSAEQNIVMIADRKEAWYMEIYSGHQYCAVRMPDDGVAVFGNEFMLDTVDPSSAICSKELFSLPMKKGFAVYEADGRMNLRKTYMGEGRLYDFSHLRTWRGLCLLAPSKTGEYNHDEYYPLFYTPDNKVSLREVMSLFRDRYQGTSYNPEANGREDVRCIGDESQQEVHIVEVYDNVPAQMACITWLTLSEAQYAPYIPFSNAITECTAEYGKEAKVYAYDPTTAQIKFKRVNALAGQDKASYGSGIRAYWEEVESMLEKRIAKMLRNNSVLYNTDPEAATRNITLECKDIQSEAIKDADRLFDDLVWHTILVSESLRYKCNFRTLVNEPSPKKPFESNFDVSAFASFYEWTSIKEEDSSSLLLQKDGKSIRITPSNGHYSGKGIIDINGTQTDASVTLKNGSFYLPLSYLSIFK